MIVCPTITFSRLHTLHCNPDWKYELSAQFAACLSQSQRVLGSLHDLVWKEPLKIDGSFLFLSSKINNYINNNILTYAILSSFSHQSKSIRSYPPLPSTGLHVVLWFWQICNGWGDPGCCNRKAFPRGNLCPLMQMACCRGQTMFFWGKFIFLLAWNFQLCLSLFCHFPSVCFTCMIKDAART